MHDASIDLSTLTDRARDVQIGRTTLAYHVRPGEVEIVSLRTPRRDRGKGSARAALTAFLQAADEDGCRVVLGASPLDARTHLGRLVDFYRSFGFELTGRVINAAGEPEMVRSPSPQTQHDITETPAFLQWFGGSQVVATDGRPLVVYHGTSADFSEFKKQATGIYGSGYYFTTSANAASDYAAWGNSPSVMPVYLSAKNLATAEDYDRIASRLKSAKAKTDALIRAGFDGLMVDFGNGRVDYLVFEPTQIKSVVGNRGTFDPNDPRILFSQSRKPTQSGIGFYSALAESVDAAQGAPKRADATAWKQWLDGAQRRGEFKQSERDWLGVDAWLDGRETTTREDLAEFVRANQVQIQDAVLGDEPADTLDDDVDGRTKFAQYQLPGGQNYRELLLTLPDRKQRWWAKNGSGEERIFHDAGDASEFAGARGDSHAVDEQTVERMRGDLLSSHWGQRSNILAHVRFNERVGAEGKRVLFVEEVQSDWHQAGRKRGYRSNNAAQPWTVFDENEGRAVRSFRTEAEAEAEAERLGGREEGYFVEASDAYAGAGISGADGVPDAPLKKEWPLTAMKRMIRWAAENGFDKVAWTTGDQQADRYYLSKQVKAIRLDGDFTQSIEVSVDDGRGWQWIKSATKTDLAGVVGKDIADKAISGGQRLFEGVDLKIGGEGMRAFYDKMLPNELAKYVKKWGGKVGTTLVEQTSFGALGRPKDWNAKHGAFSEQPSIDITLAMRDAAMEGQPLFSTRTGNVYEPEGLHRDNAGLWAPMPSTGAHHHSVTASGAAVLETSKSAETDRLAAAISDFLGAAIQVERASVDPLAAAALDRLAVIAGRRIVVYRVTDGQFRANGCVIPGDPTIYVNADSENPVLAVACHEFMHQLRRDRPDLYEFVADEVRARAKIGAWASVLRKRPLSRDLDDDTILEELVADAFGDALMDPQFLHALVEKSPSAFHAFVVAVRDFFARIVTAFGEIADLGSNRYIDDVRGVHDAYARMVDAFVRDAAVDAVADGSVDHPLPSAAADRAPSGAWVLSGFGDLRGQGIYHVRDLEVAALALPELDGDGRLAAEKRPYLAAYTQRAVAGETPPNIHVVEGYDGIMRVVDGHRRVMAARAAGIAHIRAVVALLIDLPHAGKVPLTHELAVIDAALHRRMPDVVDSLPVVRPGEVVGDYIVRAHIPNTSSIDASIERPRLLAGVRAVPLRMFDPYYIQVVRERPLDARTEALRTEIARTGELTPLIVAMDSKGAYVIEGGHRLDALIKSGASSLPALVVVDESDPPASTTADLGIEEHPVVARRPRMGF